MAEKEVMPEVIVKFKGIFDFKNLFLVMYDWLTHQGYEVSEKKFKHKVPTQKGAEEEVGWTASRPVTHYYTYQIDIDMKFMDLKEVEIVKEDKKQQLSFAKVRIILVPTVILDPENQANNTFRQEFMKFFNRFIYSSDLNAIIYDRLYYRVYKLQGVIKNYLDMEGQYNAHEGWW